MFDSVDGESHRFGVAFSLSVGIQIALLILAIFVVPFFSTSQLIAIGYTDKLFLPPPPPPGPRIVETVPAPKNARKPTGNQKVPDILEAPKFVPKYSPGAVEDKPRNDFGNSGNAPDPGTPGSPGSNRPCLGCVPGGTGNNITRVDVFRVENVPLPPPPALPALPRERMRVSSGVLQGQLVYKPELAYPLLARSARVQGAVIIEAIISKDGTIGQARVISGHILLSAAALENVKSWRYKPYLLNGDPAEVITTITVNFSFAQ